MAKSIRDTDKTAWKKLRAQIIERDNKRCLKCGRSTDLEVHHIHGILYGGTDEPENLATLCHVCHLEWDVCESGLNLPFDEWVKMPPYILLFAMYKFAGEQRSRSAGDIRDEIDRSHAALLRGAMNR